MPDSVDSTNQRYSRHGQTRTTIKGRATGIYRSWSNMIQRCTNPNNPDYKNYGGRGIKVCDRWMVSANFITDMAPKPDGWTIERINNDGPYEPGNCKWIPKGDQLKNRRPPTAETLAKLQAGHQRWQERQAASPSSSSAL